jgi:hypothetical protein
MTRLAILLVPLFLLSLFLLSVSAPTLGVEKVSRQSDGLMETQRSVCEMSSECPDDVAAATAPFTRSPVQATFVCKRHLQ